MIAVACLVGIVACLFAYGRSIHSIATHVSPCVHRSTAPTNPTGMETLGQEYCHLMFVSEHDGNRNHRFLPLSRVRRAVLVGATVVCNYVSEVCTRACVCF